MISRQVETMFIGTAPFGARCTPVSGIIGRSVATTSSRDEWPPDHPIASPDVSTKLALTSLVPNV